MTAFVITFFIINIIGAGINLGWLSNSEYPRVKKTSFGSDMFGMIVNIGMAIWAGFLIF